MGLDISVYKVKSVDDKESKEIEDFYVLSEFPELNVFEKLKFKKENTYHDIENEAKKMGYNYQDLMWNGTEYGEKTIYKFFDTKHPLYGCHLWVNQIWNNTYFDTLKELKLSEYFQKYLIEYRDTLISYGWKPKWKFFASGNKKTYYNFVNLNRFLLEKVKVIMIDPMIMTKTEDCIAYDEIGYQRKGANKQFYEDGMWDSPCILEKETLLEHWKKYFSFSTPESKGGFGSGVEFNQPDDEMSKNYKTNIIDKFIEGESFVIYH